MREPIKVIADVLVSELDLKPGQIMLAYEKFDIPATGLYIAVAYVSSKVISSTSFFDPALNQEVRRAVIRHLIQIDLMSFGDEARARKEEVVMALSSFASQKAQELNNISIASLPIDFTNASSFEETKFLNRFTATVAVTALFEKIKDTEFFDSFNAEFIENQENQFTPAAPAEV